MVSDGIGVTSISAGEFIEKGVAVAVGSGVSVGEVVGTDVKVADGSGVGIPVDVGGAGVTVGGALVMVGGGICTETVGATVGNILTRPGAQALSAHTPSTATSASTTRFDPTFAERPCSIAPLSPVRRV